LDVSTTSATSVPSSAGGALKEQELQRRILAMESKLKDVDLLIKDQMPQQKSEAAPAFEEMQQELDEMQRYRESLEARAENLEKILLKERKEHQASLEAYSNSMNKSIDAMNNSVEKSVADSTALMKARMVEAENLIRKLVGQLNYAYSKPSNHEGQPSVAGMEGQQLVSSMTQLLEEHQQLVAANQNLLAWRTDFAGVGIPTWEAITLPQNYVEPPMLLSKVDVGARSPRHRSPEGSPTGCRSPGGQLGRSPPEQLGPSPSGCRSPGGVGSPGQLGQLGRSASGQLGPSPSGCRSPGVVGSPVHSSPHSGRSPNHPEKGARRPSGSPGARSPSRSSPVGSAENMSPSPRGPRVLPPEHEELGGSPGMRFQAAV